MMERNKSSEGEEQNGSFEMIIDDNLNESKGISFILFLRFKFVWNPIGNYMNYLTKSYRICCYLDISIKYLIN